VRLVLVAATVLAAIWSASSPADAAISAAQRLANTYAPIVMTRSQENGICDSTEEQFWPPTTVDVTPGNPRVRLLRHTKRGNEVVKRALGSNGSGASIAGASISISTGAGLGRTLAAPIGSGAVTAFVRNLERSPSDDRFVAAWRATRGRLWGLIAVQLLATVLVFLIALTIIGIPYAIRKWVDWQFGQQEILFEDRSIREALRGSSRMVRGHWWHTAAVTVAFWLVSEIPGPVLGFALLFTTVPVTSVDLFGSAVSALLIPYVCVGRTLLYLDLAARRADEPAPVPTGLAPVPAA
jgi:hypothetical protein